MRGFIFVGLLELVIKVSLLYFVVTDPLRQLKRRGADRVASVIVFFPMENSQG